MIDVRYKKLIAVNNIQNSRALWQGKMLGRQVKGLRVGADRFANSAAGPDKVAGAGDMAKLSVKQSDKRNEIVAKANELVDQLFYGTLLREFHNSQQPTMLDSGPGAMTFIRQLDMELVKKMSLQGVADSKRVVESNALVRALVKELYGKKT